MCSSDLSHEGTPIIHIFGRDKDGGAHRLDVTGFTPYFYALESQRNNVPTDLKIDDNIYNSIYKEKLIKIFTKKPSDIHDIRDKFTHYEGDLLFTQRFLIDQQIKSGVSFETSPCLPNDVKPIDVNYNQRVCFVDIESDRKSTRLNSSHITRSRMPSSA